VELEVVVMEQLIVEEQEQLDLLEQLIQVAAEEEVVLTWEQVVLVEKELLY
jgi:hypothetical protein